ncbi:cobaltochelatase CobT [Amycolatopsis marina]|uniref:Cobaltochelatase CobT n=1 Tax=Amycolatopsis marina TaxID=490629 RepID=A0A1I0X0R0_9PSEU|nr:cobalt chelatase [Amycolatopsis marina]SFA94414.1 cobaltochelatase CobT [Amycolatopsis marina]
MTGTRGRTRHQHRVEELCAAAARAVSGEPEFHLRAGRPYRAGLPLPVNAPHLRPSSNEDDLGSFRGAADGVGLRLVHSDSDLHRGLRPEEPLQRLVFEMLEQYRVESQVPTGLPGLVWNLRYRFEQWSDRCIHSGLTETANGLLLYSVAQICRSRVTGQPVPAMAEDVIEATRFALAPLLGHELAGLRRHREDQQAYAVHARAVARTVEGLVAEAGRANGERETAAADRRSRNWALLLDPGDGDGFAPVPPGTGATPEPAGQGYRAFTTAYDTQRHISTLVRAEQRREFRERLDRRIAGQGVNHARLARELAALLTAPARTGWQGGQEEGYIDGRSLTQLITSPAERRLFRAERVEPVSESLVTFLLDCSGSMKAHAESIAAVVDVFTRALELAGVATEILGFTTGSWNGGRAMRDWRRSGRPRHPGRLNEVCHLVVKDADTTYRRARPDIAALLKQDLYREGVDGEAVRWACRRMDGRGEHRRFLLVFSDGSPVDSATALMNDSDYLGNHLAEVVREEERAGSARIHGLGVGLDLGHYYNRSQVLDLESGAANQVFRDILAMLSR